MSGIVIFVCIIVLLGAATVVGLVRWWRALAGPTWHAVWSNRPLLAAFSVAELAVWWVTAATWLPGLHPVAIVLHLLLAATAGALVAWCLRPPATTARRGILAGAGAGLIVIEINVLALWVYQWPISYSEGWLQTSAELLAVLILGAPPGALLGAAGGFLARLITRVPWRGGRSDHPSTGIGAARGNPDTSRRMTGQGQR